MKKQMKLMLLASLCLLMTSCSTKTKVQMHTQKGEEMQISFEPIKEQDTLLITQTEVVGRDVCLSEKDDSLENGFAPSTNRELIVSSQASYEIFYTGKEEDTLVSAVGTENEGHIEYGGLYDATDMTGFRKTVIPNDMVGYIVFEINQDQTIDYVMVEKNYESNAYIRAFVYKDVVLHPGDVLRAEIDEVIGNRRNARYAMILNGMEISPATIIYCDDVYPLLKEYGYEY